MFRKANFLEVKSCDVQIEDVIYMIEKYYDPKSTLKWKLDSSNFEIHLNNNPALGAKRT